MDGLGADVRRLRTQVEGFANAYAELARSRPPGGAGGGKSTQAAYRQLKQLQLVVDHIESSAAYLVGSGLEPEDREERVGVSQRALEGREAERERLYRDVHDGPAQALANAIFELEYIERVNADTRELRSELLKLKLHLRQSLDSVREMIHDLRPPVLSDGLASAFESYARDFEARHGIPVECALDMSATGLLPQQELAIFRVMQEALQNTHKHAHASAVRISWEREPLRWVFRCADDGLGFDLVKAAGQRRSLGLGSMRERAELIGGSLEVQSIAGQGTTVALMLPIRDEAPPA